MAAEGNSKIALLVEKFMEQVSQVTDDADWNESDGWVGKWTIGSTGLVYEITGGKFRPILKPDPKQKYTGEVQMSEDTFLDLMEAAFNQRGEDEFARKYAKKASRYKGEKWIVDSERFRKVLKRLSVVPIRSIK